MPTDRIAVMGLGIIGSGMARNLLKAGYPLTVYNRNRARVEPFEAEGASVAGSPAEAAAGADIIISAVADDAASRALFTGPDGALQAAKPGALVIESSTLTVTWVRELARLAADRGLDFLDAPVTGSRVQSAAGQLLFLVGGSAEALERARPALTVMSREIVHMGPTGSGATIKLINNFMAAVQAASLGEAMAFAKAAGLDLEKVIHVLTTGAPGSPIVKTMIERVKTPDDPTHFRLALMLKDLGYAVEEGARAGVTLRTAEAAREVYKRAVEEGLGERDMSAVVKL